MIPNCPLISESLSPLSNPLVTVPSAPITIGIIISRRYSAKTITDTDFADDIAILTNTPNQAETPLHSLERAAAGIGLHVNAHKTEYMCFNQTGDISTLEGTSLKLVDKFTYLGSSVSSTEKGHRHAANKSMDGYRETIDHMEIKPDR